MDAVLVGLVRRDGELRKMRPTSVVQGVTDTGEISGNAAIDSSSTRNLRSSPNYFVSCWISMFCWRDGSLIPQLAGSIFVPRQPRHKNDSTILEGGELHKQRRHCNHETHSQPEKTPAFGFTRHPPTGRHDSRGQFFVMKPRQKLHLAGVELPILDSSFYVAQSGSESLQRHSPYYFYQLEGFFVTTLPVHSCQDGVEYVQAAPEREATCS